MHYACCGSADAQQLADSVQGKLDVLQHQQQRLFKLMNLYKHSVWIEACKRFGEESGLNLHLPQICCGCPADTIRQPTRQLQFKIRQLIPMYSGRLTFRPSSTAELLLAG